MKTVCNYHPQKPAQWSCARCGCLFCEQCAVRRGGTADEGPAIYFCPRCDIPLNRFSAGARVEPFWKRPGRFFGYPLHAAPLGLTIVMALAAMVFSGQGLIPALAQILLLCLICKYSFTVLKTTAMGDLRPPKITYENLATDLQVVFKLFALYIIVGIVFGLAFAKLGMVMGVIVLCLAILTLPAMIIVLATSGSLLHALNPSVSMRLAWRIGGGYLLMYVFLILLGAAPAVVMGLTPDKLHPAVQSSLFMLLNGYYTIISYHLMGYLILQYHEQIGHEVELVGNIPETHADDPAGAALRQAAMFIKEGQLEDAIYVLRDSPSGPAADLPTAERYYELLRLAQQHAWMIEHAPAYLELLSRKGNLAAMCTVYEECSALDPHFTIQGTTLIKIAGGLREKGLHQEAIRAYESFIRDNQDHPLILKAYLQLATIFHEDLKNPEKAVQILRHAMDAHPHHDMVPYLDRYRRRLEEA